MSVSRKAAVTFVPLLSRLLLAAAFIPAGWDKIMGEPMVYTGRDALTLQQLGIGELVPAEALAHSDQGPLGVFQHVRPNSGGPGQPAGQAAQTEEPRTGRLSDRLRPTPPDTAPSGDPIVRTPPPGRATAAPPPKPPTRVQPKPKPTPEPPKPTPPKPGHAAADDLDAPPVKARRMYKVALMLHAAKWPDALKPGWMAWGVAATELVGGGLILLGLFSRVWGLGLAVTMVLAFWLTSLGAVADHGFFALPVADFNRVFMQLGLGILATGVMLTGAGGLSLDQALFRGGGGGDDDEHLLHLG